MLSLSPSDQLDEPTRRFYVRTLEIMDSTGVPYCVAGAYALAAHAGIIRHTKDLDIFLRRRDLPRVAAAFNAAGCHIEHTHPHWLAKAYAPDPPEAFVDLIFRAASGLWEVDDDWLDHALPGPVLGRSAPLCAPEELIWSKAMVMERDRFDGADIAHILQSGAATLDWPRLLRRAAGHDGILLGHLAFFQYIYPCQAHHIPESVMDQLFQNLRAHRAPSQPVCRGTMLSWNQYLPDLQRGFIDARLLPNGALTPEEIARWTAADK